MRYSTTLAKVSTIHCSLHSVHCFFEYEFLSLIAFLYRCVGSVTVGALILVVLFLFLSTVPNGTSEVDLLFESPHNSSCCCLAVFE